MENASKALLIAGAILLAILIISLGIMVFQNARSTVGNANLDEQEIQTFNSKFISYVGSNKTASTVESLIQTAIASNAAETKSGANRHVTIEGVISGKTEPTDLGSAVISRTKTYTIKVKTYEQGLIKVLQVEGILAATPEG